MNKAEFVDAIQAKTGAPKNETQAFVDAFTKVVEETLKKGDKVALVGFGTFQAKERKAREGRNPQNPDQIVKIPATTVPTFKPGKGFKDAIAK